MKLTPIRPASAPCSAALRRPAEEIGDEDERQPFERARAETLQPPERSMTDWLSEQVEAAKRT